MEYKEGNHLDFINYLYSSDPKPGGTIDLELPLEGNKNINLHIFEQLLMIFVDGLKYFFSEEDNKVKLTNLTPENIVKLNKYFASMNYEINVEIFKTINDYQFRYPNYFKNQEHIKSETLLKDFYYEIFNSENKAFRISFKNITKK